MRAGLVAALILLVLYGSLIGPVVAADVDQYIKDLMNEDPGVRADAADALGKLNDAQAVVPLIDTLKDDDNGIIRQITAEALGKLNDTRAVVPLIDALNDTDWGVRSEAAWALGKLNDTRAVSPLTQVLNDKNEKKDVQDAAAEALKKLGKPVAQSAK